jgi:hypothetical protein
MAPIATSHEGVSCYQALSHFICPSRQSSKPAPELEMVGSLRVLRMGVVVSIRKQKAFLRDGEWRSAQKGLESELNRITTEWILATGGPPLSAADPELDVAKHVIRLIRGRILLHAPCRPRDASRTYFALRQMALPFV